jgi:hypothetical protein
MNLVFSAEVKRAQKAKRPLVALETSVLAQGLPSPRNLEAARRCEAAVREAGATPAAMAVIDGVLHVGLDDAQTQLLATGTGLLKLGSRDLAIAVAQKRTGGTTVSATCEMAARAGLSVFATGGLGGVHRGVADDLDISQDLPAIARWPVAVVCAGAPVPPALTTALTMAERVSLVRAEFDETMGIEDEGPLAAQVARLLVEQGIDAESKAGPHLSVVTEAANKPAPSTGAKPDKTADGAVADAADDVADDAADEACGKKGVVLGGDESMPLARRLMLGRLEATLGAAGLASPVGGPDSPATPATTAAGMGDNDGAAARDDSDDSGGAVGRAKMVAAEAPDEEPPAKRAAVAEGSEAKPASKAKALAPTKAVGAAAAAKSKAVSKAVAAGKGKGDAHSNAGAKAAATAAPVPKTAPGVAAPKQAGLLGFLVRPKPSTEPAAPPAAAVGGAE